MISLKKITYKNLRINFELFYFLNPWVKEKENKELIKKVTYNEIRIAFLHINSLKAF